MVQVLKPSVGRSPRCRQRVTGGLILVLAVVLAACGSSPPSEKAISAGADLAVQTGTPESPKVRVGVSVADSAYLPLYMCVRYTCAKHGIEMELNTFQGDAEVNQALIGGAVDFNVQSLSGMLGARAAGAKVKAFFGGMNQADFAWVANPKIKSWDDLRGKSIGVTTYGSLTDSLTRYTLNKQGVTPEKDVRIVQAGGSPTSWPTIRAGALDAGILSINFWLQAKSEGFTILGYQKDMVAPTWPKEVFAAPEAWLQKNPNTATAVLRGFSDAVTLLKNDKEKATATLVDELKYKSPERAAAVYDVIAPEFHADGRIPVEAMDVFWKIQQDLDVVEGPLEDDEYLDSRWIDSYKEWAPK
ncbi:MAG: hypothetical protein JWN57_288 [Frankiales bacterium]|jgi:NitT/TauT family transport system substrate-binding protein|nr:hypothetical protein [Frankiales bacterium]